MGKSRAGATSLFLTKANLSRKSYFSIRKGKKTHTSIVDEGTGFRARIPKITLASFYYCENIININI
jgi:hypothetical protein